MVLSTALSVFIGGPVSPAAASEASVVTYSVFSEYPAAENSAFRERRWRVVWDANSDGTEVATLFQKDSEKPICRLVRRKAEKNTVVEYMVPEKTPNEGVDGLALSPGFPAPCDAFPRHQSETEKTYRTTTVAGGRTFEKRYHVVREEIAKDAAIKKGWIRPTVPLKGDTLRMWTVRDDKRRIVGRQLWAEKQGLWLYEETPYRRSWRLD